MRRLSLLALACLAVPATAMAGTTTTTRVGEQLQRQDMKRSSAQCAARDRERPGRDGSAKADCKVNRPVPPVVDPTPLFLP